ncbi:hypothetical protein HELRODRAFT_165907 [Helobdella robusta]|uniref:Uncharacterized protein n=1 Tax=Helobdella robusta TaxID=6412 RepID=T1EXF6_HELRO|nr:hypothetical protein HELRODRAFT_165907 [Helobdella robusta]ESN91825.1 hypothetical protein HELRODRAFT_165907 [Helobdella robusta]
MKQNHDKPRIKQLPPSNKASIRNINNTNFINISNNNALRDLLIYCITLINHTFGDTDTHAENGRDTHARGVDISHTATQKHPPMAYYQSSYNASSDESPSSYPGFTIAKLPPITVHQDADANSATSTARCYKKTRRSSKSRLHKTVSDDSLAIRYKRMKWAVVVMTTLMIVASMLLVGVSLAMAEHIDDLGMPICMSV